MHVSAKRRLVEQMVRSERCVFIMGGQSVVQLISLAVLVAVV